MWYCNQPFKQLICRAGTFAIGEGGILDPQPTEAQAKLIEPVASVYFKGVKAKPQAKPKKSPPKKADTLPSLEAFEALAKSTPNEARKVAKAAGISAGGSIKTLIKRYADKVRA